MRRTRSWHASCRDAPSESADEALRTSALLYADARRGRIDAGEVRANLLQVMDY